jgi:glucokinase
MRRLMPYSGLFLVGAMSTGLMHWIQGSDSPFMKAYLQQGCMSQLAAEVPVYLVLASDLGQRGAHFFAVKNRRSDAHKQHSISSSSSRCTLMCKRSAYI